MGRIVPIIAVALLSTELTARQPTPVFVVASVKPMKAGSDSGGGGFFPGGRFSMTGTTVAELVRLAYGVADYQVLDAPSWLTSEKYVIDARARTANGGVDPARADVRLMLQSLLADRFKLVVRRDSREMPVYVLEMVREDKTLGNQLRRSTMDCSTNNGKRAGEKDPASRSATVCHPYGGWRFRGGRRGVHYPD
jgi:uncharacterized protein (TIGR03435 family)